MTPRRVQDLEGAKGIALNSNSQARAIAAISKRKFMITCYTEQAITRLKLDPTLRAGNATKARTCAKKILIYEAHIRP